MARLRGARYELEFEDTFDADTLDSKVGQHRFAPDAVVREARENVRLYTPLCGRIEMRARATDDPHCLAALWISATSPSARRGYACTRSSVATWGLTRCWEA